MPAACIRGQAAGASGLPSTAPAPPTIITAGSSGRTRAFATGPISESWWKLASINGQVAVSAAMVAANGSRSTAGIQANRAAIRSVIAAIPMVPAKES